MATPTFFDDVYLLAASRFLPGKAITNEEMDAYIAPLDHRSKRVKQKVLAENGIETRHYALDEHGETTLSHTAMACAAARACLQQSKAELLDIDLLTAATSGGDVIMPGLANMIQGELHAPPMETHSHQGVCASSVLALKDAAQTLAQTPDYKLALSVAAEMPSRIFKRSRFASQDYQADFEAHFLRWMLSDGAGAVLLGNEQQAVHYSSPPLAQQKLALRLNWVHAKSFSGDYPVCMQLGQGSHRQAAADAHKSWLDYSSAAEAEAAGHFALRQNLRLLPNLFEVAVHEYAALVQAGHVQPDKVDTFLCHYSSEALGKTCEDLMQQAGLGIPREKWFSNLRQCGNTGAASIFIMLADYLQQQPLWAGQKIFAFVPESGRFTVSYFMLEVVDMEDKQAASEAETIHLPEPPISPSQAASQPSQPDKTQQTLLQLAEVWHSFRSAMWRTPLVQKLNVGQFTQTDYLRWMEQWIPQVREGSLWMRQAAGQLDKHYPALAHMIHAHAREEQDDFQILFQDYQVAGGTAPSLDSLQRNAGGEALNSYMHRAASQTNPIGLLGGIYIIEGTGQRIVPCLLPLLKQQLNLPEPCYRFLQYHGENDAEHLQHWLSAVQLALASDGEAAQQAIVRTAQQVATLYQLQMELVL